MPIFHALIFFLILNYICLFGQYDSNSKSYDTLLINQYSNYPNDTSQNERLSPQAIQSKIFYKATDSIVLYVRQNTIYLYGNVEIEQEKLKLSSAFVRFDFENKLLLATGMNDSSGKYVNRPHLQEHKSWFIADTIKYNFETKKGYLVNVYAIENDIYIQGDKLKRLSDSTIFISKGSFTTCSDPHPHFKIKFTKAKVIPNDKIITGPIWLEVENLPTPLIIPFGFFPNKKKRQNGLLIPKIGESANRGFYLEDGGFYMGYKDYVDLALRGDAYTRGSWAMKIASNYKKRYAFQGFLNINYAVNKIGVPETPDYEVSRDFFIIWKHTQDPKAHPKHQFNADVRAGSRNYTRFNPSSAHDYLSSTFASSINFSTTFMHATQFSANIRHSQNKQTRIVEMYLPEILLTTPRIIPFRNNKIAQNIKFLRNLNISYSLNARNQIQAPDSLLLKHLQKKYFANGLKQVISISTTQKILRYWNITSGFNYNQRYYTQSVSKYWDEIREELIVDTLYGINISQDFSFSTQLQTKIYGMYMMAKGPIAAIRHVITPNISFSYRPDFGKSIWREYHYYRTPNMQKPAPYSKFEQGIYGYAPFGRAGILQLSLLNNLEAKIRKNDTLNPIKKISLIENFQLSISHDFAKDSLRWSKLRLSGRTRLFQNLDISYIAFLDPYIIDSTGKNLNRYEWAENKKLFRISKNEWATNFNWMITKKTLQSITKNNKENNMQDDESNFFISMAPNSISWRLNITYTLQYVRNYDLPQTNDAMQIIQTLSFGGEINPSPGWKINAMSGYDFKNKDFSYTSINIYRDLHCWEIEFNWIPFGFRKSYNFTLRAKSSLLQDVKIRKRTDWRDYY